MTCFACGANSRLCPISPLILRICTSAQMTHHTGSSAQSRASRVRTRSCSGKDADSESGERGQASSPQMQQQSATSPVLGAFAIYRQEAGAPGDFELALLERGAQLAALAIEHRQFAARRRGRSDAATSRRRGALPRETRREEHGARLFPTTDAKLVGRLGLQTDLYRALERDEFRLNFQPQVELLTGRLLGFEALLRWHHPELGIISPAKSIPIAEDTGLIVPIGAWVLREACRHLQEWKRSGLSGLKLAVNVSAVQFAQPDWVEVVASSLHEFHAEPTMLELELTETAVLQNVEESARQMARLRELGVSISVDDFGTGYASLSRLHSLRIDKLKIDLTFIRQIEDCGPHPSLVESIIDLGNKLGLRVTAEGVETEYQLGILRNLQCHEAQGFLIGRPMDAAEMTKHLQRRPAGSGDDAAAICAASLT